MLNKGEYAKPFFIKSYLFASYQVQRQTSFLATRLETRVARPSAIVIQVYLNLPNTESDLSVFTPQTLKVLKSFPKRSA